MNLKLKGAYDFTKGQIQRIAEVHPELGRYLAAEAFFAGSVAARMKQPTAPSNYTVIPGDTLFKINPKASMPQEGSNLAAVTTSLIERYQDQAFMYQDVKDLAHQMGFNTGLPTHLREKGVIVKVD